MSIDETKVSVIKGLARSMAYILGHGEAYDKKIAEFEAMPPEERERWTAEAVKGLQKLAPHDMEDTAAQQMSHAYELALVKAAKDGIMTRDQARRICRDAEGFWDVLDAARLRLKTKKEEGSVQNHAGETEAGGNPVGRNRPHQRMPPEGRRIVQRAHHDSGGRVEPANRCDGSEGRVQTEDFSG